MDAQGIAMKINDATRILADNIAERVVVRMDPKLNDPRRLI